MNTYELVAFFVPLSMQLPNTPNNVASGTEFPDGSDSELTQIGPGAGPAGRREEDEEEGQLGDGYTMDDGMDIGSDGEEEDCGGSGSDAVPQGNSWNSWWAPSIEEAHKVLQNLQNLLRSHC
ncbi:hypothetical protein BS17DRAFT_763583 [Gyrodon lividus]|nr:hypothetical protein BS17DRAFT_763583 [Gyrodon lividus]